LAETLTSRVAEHLTVVVPDQGMHLVAYFKAKVSDVQVETAAARIGIIVRAISRFYRAVPPRSGLMLGFSGFPRQLIIPAASRLAAFVANPKDISRSR